VACRSPFREKIGKRRRGGRRSAAPLGVVLELARELEGEPRIESPCARYFAELGQVLRPSLQFGHCQLPDDERRRAPGETRGSQHAVPPRDR
jgi:hypothetical protein